MTSGADRDLLAAYRATVWTIFTSGAPTALRLAEAAPLPEGQRPSGIVTAWNPGSALRSDQENRAAQERLREALERLGAHLVPALATGVGPDADRWNEPSFLVVGVPRGPLVETARRFGQNAIVWIDEAGVPSLVATRPGFCGAAPGDTL